MLEQIDLYKILFLDIETVSQEKNYSDLSEDFKELWKSRAKRLSSTPPDAMTDTELGDLYKQRAAIYAEFGKIICISVGVFTLNKKEIDKPLFRTFSYADRNERVLLEQFSEMLEKYFYKPNTQYICGHNIREFDIPYICRRLVANQMQLPAILDISGKKPWETKHLLDTMDQWRFGDYKNYTSLKLLAAVMGFPSPKDDIDGGDVGRVFWEENNLERIAVYCEKDVLAVAQLLRRFRREPILEDEQLQKGQKKASDDVSDAHNEE